MGKMRVYLDADDQPALTFPLFLFCGALLNCAMVLTPLEQPATAFEQLLAILLQSFRLSDNVVPRAKGLLRHMPVGGATSLWAPEQSQIPTPEEILQDFRQQFAFQQVIADCTHDQEVEELKQEKLETYYEIPDRLVASFHPDTLALISNKFRMFDVNDTGMVPRQELFALLSRLGTRVDLPDPYTILSKLSAVMQREENNGDTTGGELTLVQLLQVIEVARETKRHSATSNLAAIKVRVDRAAAAVRGNIPSLPSSQSALGDDDNANSDSVTNARKASGRNKSGNTATSPSFRDRGKRHGAANLKSRKSTLSNNTETNASSKSLLANKHQSSIKTHPSHHTTGSSRKKTRMHRRKSSVAKHKLDSSVDSNDLQDNSDEESVLQTQRSGTTVCSIVKEPVDLTMSGNLKRNDNHDLAADNEEDHGLQLEYVPRSISVQVHEPLSATNSKMIRIFLLLGGEHDGAIYFTISLVFSTRKIEETEGIYYSTAPCEATRTTPVLPTQHTLINALLMLKKCVQAKLEQGFELRPATQIDIVDRILEDKRNRQPHFCSPVTKTSRNNTIPVSTLPDVRDSTRCISSAQSELVGSSQSRPHNLPPHSKRDHYKVHLPNNYKNVLASWHISQHENYAWIHDINAASPLKPATPTPTLNRSGLLSPLRLPIR
ncbi:hypothetical protein PHMEG_0003830 [Phytophthora megakarya]|uniref:EF-hand domain-containing protein n=1 Tax=Phytophthora megakarya TaxID=4795 RepID=A0A225WVD6_9STRA|nr:hypothetical protein PHMEG_0003830 [Phytophthora megakarya]